MLRSYIDFHKGYTVVEGHYKLFCWLLRRCPGRASQHTLAVLCMCVYNKIPGYVARRMLILYTCACISQAALRRSPSDT